jgi:hypothetical protein
MCLFRGKFARISRNDPNTTPFSPLASAIRKATRLQLRYDFRRAFSVLLHFLETRTVPFTLNQYTLASCTSYVAKGVASDERALLV